MAQESGQKGGDLFIVDNSDQDWKVRRYLHDWADLAHSFDIATGYFEIGALLALDGQWQKLDKIRILMGDEVSKRTKKALLAGLENIKQKLDTSIEKEKEQNDFLKGVPGILDALRSGKIVCRVYNKEKFHAKAYITHAKQAIVGSSALVGSSNFTVPGLTDNVELNVQLRREVEVLQEWFERHWEQAEEITPDILQVVERQTALYAPFYVYARALHEFFRRHEMTDYEWLTAGPENAGSRIYKILDYYQQEGYQELVGIANQYHGAFLCDGVGLGKTFIGLMLIESLIKRQRKRVALFVPKAARKPVWESKLRQYLPELFGEYSNLAIYNHTDLMRGGEYPDRLNRIKELADVIIVDEAHHFRNPGLKGDDPSQPLSHYWAMSNMCEGKDVYLLTATPINNRLLDLQHMIELFSQRKADYFKVAPLGIHSLSGHFRKMEKELEKQLAKQGVSKDEVETNQVEASEVLGSDSLFRALVVQRSRAYVKRSQEQHASAAKALFPKREEPRVVAFNLKKTYGRLLQMIEQAFSKEKPLFALAIYYPLAYYKGPDTSIDPLTHGRQKEVVSLIRIQFLKRFESSARAFELSCANLMKKLLAWLIKHCQTDHELHRLDRWKTKYSDLIGYCNDRQLELFGGDPSDEEDEDIVSEEMIEAVEELSREEYKVEDMIDETIDDLVTIADFLQELQKFKVEHDDKLKALLKLLKTDSVLKSHKVIIFSEYMATARYLKQQLSLAGLKDVDEVDSAVDRDRGEIINQFAPYYNGMSTGALAKKGLKETRILISTDVLSEGLNLQDATRLINYDLHWNPVRLMQRIGRVDRRMDPGVEHAIATDHPDRAAIRGLVIYWNFLPPDELDELLKLYTRVSHKVLRISRTFGIEGKKLLKPEDDYEALKDFTHAYEGATSPLEEMNLEYQKLLLEHPGLAKALDALPGRLFSGKEHPKPGTKAVFFCYAMPSPPSLLHDGTLPDDQPWSVDGGATQWYLYDVETEAIENEPARIIGLIRSKPETPRKHDVSESTLSEIRAKVEKHIKNTYLKQVQAPIGVKPSLKAWMELS
jgi:HKD family nuclease/superfamily II DNA or RNA helicase